MRKTSNPLIAGIVLTIVFCYLIWYFCAEGMWNPATVVVLILIAGLAAGQYFIHFKFFRAEKRKLPAKRKIKK